jgi:hypothetical protein
MVLHASREGDASRGQDGHAACALNAQSPEPPGDNAHRKFQENSVTTNNITRDNFGMHADGSSGPGPALRGADTLLGNDVCNQDGESLGDTLNVPKAVLKDAPGFNKDRWPSMSDNTWAAGVHKFYGTV